MLDVLKNEKFDIVLCNILSDILVKLLDDIKYILKDSSKIIFSGIIEDKLDMVLTKAEEVGLKLTELRESKEWRAVVLENVL